MKAIKNFNAFKKSLLSATNGNMVESFDSSNQFGGCEYQSYRVYVDDVHYYNMFVIYNFATNTYDVSLETSTCAVSTMSRVCKTQKAMIDSVVRWCYYSYLNTKEISVDSEEYTDRCTESEKTETNKIKGHIYIDTDSVIIAPLPEKKVSESYRKHLNAIMNPEWHHVSLATLANLDFDMLDEKRQIYLSAYRDLKQTLSYLRKCKTQDTYDTCFIRYTRRKNLLWAEGKISDAMWKYIERKLSMQNVESGVWASKCEDATGHHESRRYNKSRA